MKADILPSNVIEHDLKRPAWETTRDWDMPYEARQFELWAVTGFGWCIPTLDIGRHRGASTRRTYAVRVRDGQTVRIGAGPHVTRTVVVYLSPKTAARLQPFLDLRAKGQGDAGLTRDRISLRRGRRR